MKKITKLSLAVVLAVATVIVAVEALAQIPPPVLSITLLGTNQFNITLNNTVSGTAYALYWTPVLNDEDYPWTAAGLGTNGQTNFLIDGEGYSSGFFMALVSTSTIPVWELADPNNPGLGILAVTIDSPINGAVIQ